LRVVELRCGLLFLEDDRGKSGNPNLRNQL